MQDFHGSYAELQPFPGDRTGSSAPMPWCVQDMAEMLERQISLMAQTSDWDDFSEEALDDAGY